MWRTKYVYGVLVCFTILALATAAEEEEDEENEIDKGIKARKKKIFSVLQIVTFPNQPCIGTSQNGTCYTSAECAAKGGEASGTCANSYGVCCVFSFGCGTTSSQNCTYFTSTSSNIGSCTLKICPCNDNICQLRLDFNTFSITGPSTDTTISGFQLNGNPVLSGAPGANAVSTATRCLVDTFQVTNPGGNAPCSICGLNTGQHMYLDASQECNNLNFDIGAATTGANWNIKVTQYSCDYNNLAPPGCNQYFFGTGGTGTVMTYNYQGGEQLANQNDHMCVRICWFSVNPTDVSVSGSETSKGYAAPNNCCRYGNSGTMTKGYDCVIIPGALKVTGNTMVRSRMCGQIGLIGTNVGNPAVKTQTVCSCRQPFMVIFKSNNNEFTGISAAGMPREANNKNKGVKLSYFEDANCGAGATPPGR